MVLVLYMVLFLYVVLVLYVVMVLYVVLVLWSLKVLVWEDPVVKRQNKSRLSETGSSFVLVVPGLAVQQRNIWRDDTSALGRGETVLMLEPGSEAGGFIG